MPQFTLHRNHTLRTSKGHSILFKKGEPTWVPPLCVEDVVAIGAVPVDGEVDVIPADAAPKAELTPAERKQKITDAIGILLARNERGDFTGNNMPHCKKLQAITDFEVSTDERDEVWREFQAKAQEPKE